MAISGWRSAWVVGADRWEMPRRVPRTGRYRPDQPGPAPDPDPPDMRNIARCSLMDKAAVRAWLRPEALRQLSGFDSQQRGLFSLNLDLWRSGYQGGLTLVVA